MLHGLSSFLPLMNFVPFMILVQLAENRFLMFIINISLYYSIVYPFITVISYFPNNVSHFKNK